MAFGPRFGLVPERVGCVGTIDDLRHQDKGVKPALRLRRRNRYGVRQFDSVTSQQVVEFGPSYWYFCWGLDTNSDTVALD